MCAEYILSFFCSRLAWRPHDEEDEEEDVNGEEWTERFECVDTAMRKISLFLSSNTLLRVVALLVLICGQQAHSEEEDT